MKKLTINKVFISTISLILCFMSCKDDKPTGKGDASIISVTNVGDSNIVSVAAFIWGEGYGCNQDLDMIATCKYESNGFNLVLPAVLDGKYLDECFESENAKGAELTCILGLDKDGEAIGEFVLEDGTMDGEAFYVYVDRNFTDKHNDIYVETNFEDHYIHNCYFNKGWNIMYNYVIRTEIDSKNIYTWVTTTQNPPDRNFKWCYYSFNDDYDDKNNIKNKHFKSKILKKLN